MTKERFDQICNEFKLPKEFTKELWATRPVHESELDETRLKKSIEYILLTKHSVEELTILYPDVN